MRHWIYSFYLRLFPFAVAASVFAVVLALGCTAAQQAAVSREAQAVHDATTQPAVVATATALNPVTGGLSGLGVAITSILSGAVAGYFGAKPHAGKLGAAVDAATAVAGALQSVKTAIDVHGHSLDSHAESLDAHTAALNDHAEIVDDHATIVAGTAATAAETSPQVAAAKNN